jgi:phosphoribosylamine-glycine ligase
MKKALVLGVGNAQVDLIRYLKAESWQVIGCSYRREGRGLDFVSQFALLNITDADGIERLARAEKVDLIYSIGSDLAMPTIARVASRLGLPSLVCAETAELLQNKILLRGFLNKNAISPIRHKKVCEQCDLDDWRIFPAIVKPVDNQGQRGVFLVPSLKEARAGLETSLQFSRSKTLIIEEFLEGPEVSVNTFVVNGETIFNEVSDRLVVEGYAGGIPRGHIYPSVYCPADVRSDVQTLTALCNHALGIQNGPVYYQVILTCNGPRIVEVTPRLDGCHMWRLIKMTSGVDLLEACVRRLLGDAPPGLQVKSQMQPHYLGFHYLPPGMEFCQADYIPSAEVEYNEYYYSDGEAVRPINGYLEKVGYYVEQYVQ